MNRRSVCYVVMECSESSVQHFAHIPRLLAEIGKVVDLFVIVERAEGEVKVENARQLYVQRHRGKSFRRVVELVQSIRRVRRQGCRTFFWRASAWMVLIVGMLAPFLDIEIYFWASGDVKNVLPRWRSFRKRSSVEFAHRCLWLVGKLVPHFVTGPERMAAYYTREFGVKPDKIIILYNDIDVRRFAGLRATTSKWSIRRQLGIAEGERLVLFVGRISLSKGGYNVIPVIADVLLQVPRVKCLMIGSILLEDFRDKLAARGLQDSIVLLGAMPNPEVVKYYLAADVLIVPSESEGFPRRLLEAMVLGVPFVSFDVGGVRDIVDQRQLDCIVPARNTALFAQRVVKLLSDEELRQELVQVGFEQVQRYSTERVARMFVDRIVGDSEESAVDMSRAEGGCF